MANRLRVEAIQARKWIEYNREISLGHFTVNHSGMFIMSFTVGGNLIMAQYVRYKAI